MSGESSAWACPLPRPVFAAAGVAGVVDRAGARVVMIRGIGTHVRAPAPRRRPGGESSGERTKKADLNCAKPHAPAWSPPVTHVPAAALRRTFPLCAGTIVASMKCRILLIFLCLAASAAPAGTLLTRDGQTLTGDLSLAESQITLKPADGPARTFALNHIVQ